MGAQARLPEQDRQLIGLFPGGAAGDPNPDRIIDITIVDSKAPHAGVGEPGTPVIAPALTAAIFNATGKRIRELPLKRTKLV